jgi:hypothetical protein
MAAKARKHLQYLLAEKFPNGQSGCYLKVRCASDPLRSTFSLESFDRSPKKEDDVIVVCKDDSTDGVIFLMDAKSFGLVNGYIIDLGGDADHFGFLIR